MSESNRKNTSRDHVRVCVVINQFATPGLGSVLCRKFVSGIGQMILASAGFVLLLGWMAQFFYRLWLRTTGEPPPQHAYSWWGKWGLILFGTAWFWALLTSIGLWREARRRTNSDPE